MKKIPCLFERTFHERGKFTLHETPTPGCEWVLGGEGIATRKWDGTACLVSGNGRYFYKRYDAKKDKKTGEYRTAPEGSIPCDDPDPTTGHWPHWVLVGDEPESKWHKQAWLVASTLQVPDGTYELVGPQINGNPDNEPLGLRKHGDYEFHSPAFERSFSGIRAFLGENKIEGIVFHHPDGRMAKIRRADFGFAWGAKKGSSTP